MRYARSLFLPAVSYITRRYLDVTTITVISAIEIGKGLCKRLMENTTPCESVVYTYTFKQCCLGLTLLRPHFKLGTPTT